jgi:hypothetical protein
MVLRSTVYKQNKNKKYIYYIQKNAIKHINNLLVYLPPIILRSTVYKQFFFQNSIKHTILYQDFQ